MTKWRKASCAAAALSVVALVLPFSASPALAATQTFEEEVEFAGDHPCTHEPLEGDQRVHMTITTTDNPNGTMTVRIHQHTHGQQLLGLVSGDWYVFNEGEDSVSETTLLGPAGTTTTKTIFVHTSEDLAFQESAQGLDDYHQRLVVTFSPLLPPTVLKDTGECK